MRRYLLGDLPESETNELEAEVLRDDEKFEQMWELENRLVDDYVRDRLTPSDRARFERHYQASPIHRQRVAVARKLVDEADASRPAVVPPSGPGVQVCPRNWVFHFCRGSQLLQWAWCCLR